MFDAGEKKSAWFEFNVVIILLLATWFLNVASVRETPLAVLLFVASSLLGVFLIYFGREKFGLKSDKTLAAFCAVAVAGFFVGAVLAKSWSTAFASIEFVALVFFVLPPFAFLARKQLLKRVGK